MRVSREQAEELFEGMKNVLGVMDCLHATDSICPDIHNHDYYDDVEISITSHRGEGSFTLKMGSGELSGLHEVLSGIENSLRVKLSRDCGVEVG